MSGESDKKSPQPVSVQHSHTPDKKATRVVSNDGTLAKIVVYEKEDLTNDEIFHLLNVGKCTKIDVDKHYGRINGIDIHEYTVYSVLI